MDDRKMILNKFYTESCDEDTRLDVKHRKLEYLTTIKYIDMYLKKTVKF